MRFRLLGHSLKIKDKRLRVKKKLDKGFIIERSKSSTPYLTIAVLPIVPLVHPSLSVHDLEMRLCVPGANSIQAIKFAKTLEL